MRAEFLRATEGDDPDRVVGTARWDGSRVAIQADADDQVAKALWRIFRTTAVGVDDPALRTAGTAGPVVLAPGSLQWFLAAAKVRGEAEGLRVRFVPDASTAIGWDPAGAYRPFTETVARLARD
jgi:hypothetical protein